MYDLHYTFLTELEVDTRQSFDDLSDDLLLLDKNAEESQTVDMKSVISSWQNFFWKSQNTNKQLLDITFTDLLIERKANDPTKDWQGNPLNDQEMMSYGELEEFLSNITSWGGDSDWEGLKTKLVNALSALHGKYTDINNIYPISSVIVSDAKPNFGTWAEKRNYYLSEVFSKSFYNVNPGANSGTNRTLNNINLVPTAAKPPSHSHKLKYIPESGGGGSSSNSEIKEVSCQYTNVRQGTKRGAGPFGFYTGHASPNQSIDVPVVKTDANTVYGEEGERSAEFNVSKAKIDPADRSINVSPKTYPLSAVIWERTA